MDKIKGLNEKLKTGGLLLIFFLIAAISFGQDRVIEERNGDSFFVHQVASGHTLYSLSKLYGLEVEDIVKHNEGADQHIHEQALAVIRAEHPPMLKKACFHEEIAQGLGLHNDNPAAHPSIFNDDDEFAFLTNQDALLLRVLYDPRLPAGIELQEAQPLLKQLIIEHNAPSR